jgi:hypothetical protein
MPRSASRPAASAPAVAPPTIATTARGALTGGG